VSGGQCDRKAHQIASTGGTTPTEGEYAHSRGTRGCANKRADRRASRYGASAGGWDTLARRCLQRILNLDARVADVTESAPEIFLETASDQPSDT